MHDAYDACSSMRKNYESLFLFQLSATGFEFDDSLFTSICETEFDVIQPPQHGLALLADQQHHLGARPKRKNRRGRMSRERAYGVRKVEKPHAAAAAASARSTAGTHYQCKLRRPRPG
jgi:hypothetical protein